MKSPKYQFILFLLISIYITPISAANLIPNSSFETNTLMATAFNMNNADLTAAVDSVTGFGLSNEIDLVMGLGIDGISAQDGDWRLRLHTKDDDDADMDAFSIALSSNLVIGQMYELSFYAAGSSAPKDVAIGLSNDANSFGTNIFASSEYVQGRWTQLTTMFTATDAWSFLTVKSGSTKDAIANVDNFVLEEAVVPIPAAALLFISGIVGLAWRGCQVQS